MAEWNSGDVVELKSGGPKMTIQTVVGGVVHCQWFVDAELKKGAFDPESLRAAKAE
jgi:uncharacterized protein YodC (DUF2158 family)